MTMLHCRGAGGISMPGMVRCESDVRTSYEKPQNCGVGFDTLQTEGAGAAGI